MSRFYADLCLRMADFSPDPKRELSLIAQRVAGISSDRFLLLFLTDSLPEPTERQREEIESLVALRSQGEPLQYLLGSADFYGRSFAVRRGVLIPRFDTEILVDTALEILSDGDSVLDLCAGTGCIGLTLGAERNVRVTEVEKYDAAFSVLRENAAAVCPSARLIRADVLTDPIDGEYDMIVSNPPYIPTADLQTLCAEVLREPLTALDGGEDGLDFYRVLVRRFAPHLRAGGTLLFECGIGQASALEAELRAAGFVSPFRVRDYGGVERVVGAKKPKEV